jgi:LCP family protein required for cell wall assembly
MSRYDDPGDSGWPQSSRAARSSPKGRRRHSMPALIFRTLAVIVAFAVTVGALAAYMEYRKVWDGIKRISVASDMTGKQPPVDPNALNILVIGSDSRSGINGAIGGRSNVSGQRSDTVMVLHIAPGSHQIVVLSIPRDSVVPILSCAPEDGAPGQTAQPATDVEQINATFSYGGPGCLWKTIQQTTGIHINDFVELTFVGFQKVIDALHGVTVCLPVAIDDPISRLHLSAGRHHVYGREALAFWRTREGVGEGDDPQRIQRDQFLMASLVQGIEHSGLLKSPGKMLSVIRALTGHGYLTTDTGLSVGKMLQIGQDLRGIATQKVQFIMTPWTSYAGNAQWIHSSQSPATGNVNWVQWVQPQANNLFNAIAHDTKLPKAAKKKKGSKSAQTANVSPATVHVRVLNGTATAGLGATTATSLSQRGFDVVGTASNAPTQNYVGSVIEYRSAAELARAQTLAALFGKVTLQRVSGLRPGMLTLILGSNFTALKAATGNAGIQNLAGTYGGITGNINICKDSNAFSGPG